MEWTERPDTMSNDNIWGKKERTQFRDGSQTRECKYGGEADGETQDAGRNQM